MGGRRDDPPPERSVASRCHQCDSQWVRRKTNYQRNDWRVRQAPLPSLLQMDIIKPLAGEWGLMTPSGPILGLNKRWKIKLRSKLQPACSRAVYQQRVRNQGRQRKGWAVFPYSSVVVVLRFLPTFLFLPDDRGTFFFFWRNLSSTSGPDCKPSCRRSSFRVLNESDDLGGDTRGRDLKRLPLLFPLGSSLSVFTSAVPYIRGTERVEV